MKKSFPHFPSSYLSGTVLILVVLLTLPIPSPAQEAQEEAPFRIKKIFVPVDNPKIWLTDDLQTVTIDEFKRLLQAAKPRRTQPPAATIGRAEYSASFNAATNSISGSLSYEVNKDSSDAKFLRLDPIGLAISKLSWDDGDAIWGTDQNGHIQLFVDRQEVGMSGTWNLAGRPRISSTEFDFQIAPAVISKLRLLLPNQFVLQCAVGDVTGPIRSGRRDWSLWELNLGSRTTAQLQIRNVQESNRKPAEATLYERHSAYVFREADLEMRTRLYVDVLNAERQKFDLLVSGSTDIQSVLYGGEQSIAWELSSDVTDGVKRVRITLPAPLTGRSQPISITAKSPVRLGQPLKLPKIQIDGGVFMSGSVQLKVESPLVLRDVFGSGVRQTGTVSAEGIETLDFDESTPSSRISVNVEYPKPYVVTNCLTEIDTAAQTWVLRSESHWFDRSGLTYAVHCRIAPEWEITDVRAKSASSSEDGLSNWHVSETDGMQTLLDLEFKDALTANSPHVVEIVARRRPTRRNKQTHLPIIEPLDCEEVDQLTAVVHSNSVNLLLADETRFDRIVPAEFEKKWNDMELSQQFGEMSSEEVTFFRSRNRIQPTQLNLQSSTPQLDVVAHTELRLGREELTEEISIQFQPRFEFVDHVFVYFTKSANNLRWSLKDAPSTIIEARRLPIARHAQLGVPRTGELWELSLPVPTDASFTVVGVGGMPSIVTQEPALPFVPKAASFEGDIQLLTAMDLAVDVNVHSNLSKKGSLSAHLDDGEWTQHGAWHYESNPTRFKLHTPDLHPANHELKTATLRLESRIAADNGRWDAHRAEFQAAEDSRFHGFQFRLSVSAELLGVTSDGKALRTIRNNDEYSVVSEANQFFGNVVIHYRTPGDSGFLEARRLVVLPNVTHDIRWTQWKLLCPDNIRIQSTPNALQFKRLSADPSWLKQLFGPIGRRRQSPFNPFNTNDWRQVAGIENSDEAMQDQSATAASSGWVEYEAAYFGMPAAIQLTTYNITSIRLLSWIVTLATLVIALILRLARRQYRFRIGTLWLCLSLAGIVFVPSVYAEIPGGCLVAVIVAALIPRRVLLKPVTVKVDDESQPSLKTTIALHNATALLLFVMLPVMTSSIFAQEPTENRQSAPSVPVAKKKDGPRLFRLWVPVDHEFRRPANAPFVHPSKELLEYLRNQAAARNQPTEYVISRARYSAEIADGNFVTLHAKFNVAVFSGKRNVRVLLPLHNVNLNGDSPCTVDGAVSDIKSGKDGKGFVVDIPRTPADEARPSTSGNQGSDFEAPQPSLPQPKNPPPIIRTHVIELHLHPVVSTTVDGSSVAMAVPEVCESSLSIASSERLRISRLNGHAYSKDILPTQSMESVAVGRTASLVFQWSRPDAIPQKAIATDVSCLCLVEIRPVYLKYRCRVSFSQSEGSRSSRFELAVPADATLIDVKTETPSVHQLNAQQTGPSHLVIDFDQPQSDKVIADIEFIRPALLDAANKRDVQTYVPVDDGDERYNLISNDIGIVSASGFELRPASNSLESISSDTFLESWTDSQDVRRPQAAYQVVGPDTLKFELFALTSLKRVVAHSQVGRISRNRLEWSANIEVETTAASVFQYRLDIDPRLKIESVHVFDEAERLQGHSRVANELILFLKDASSGIQNIVVQASMPVVQERETPIPYIRLDAIENATATTSLFREPTLDVELIGVETTNPQPNESTDEMSFLATFDVAAESVAAAIRIRSRQDTVQSESVMEIDPQPDGTLDITTTFLFHDVKPRDTNIRLTIPSEVSGDHQIDIAEFEYETVDTKAGDVIVKLIPRPQDSGDLKAIVRTRIQAEVDGRIQLPLITTDGSEITGQFLVVHPHRTMRVTNSTLSKIPLDELPGWFTASADTADETSHDTVFQLNQNQVVELHLETVPGSRRSEIALADTRVRWPSRQIQSGRTTFYTIGQLNGPLVVNVPEGIELVKIYVNDRPQAHELSDDRQLQLESNASDQVSTVTVQWTKRFSFGILDSVRRIETEIPFPAEVPVLRHVVSHDVDKDVILWTKNVLTPASQDDVALDWLEGLVDYNEAAFREAGNVHVATWKLVQAGSNRLANEIPRTSHSAGGSPRRLLQERLASISRRIESLSAKLPQSVEIEAGVSAWNSLPNFVSSHGSHQRSVRNPPSGLNWPVWVVDWMLTKLVFAILSLVLGLYTARRFLKLQPGEWLARHPATAWFILGIFWWLCLTPSVVGIVLMLVSAICAVRTRPAALTVD